MLFGTEQGFHGGSFGRGVIGLLMFGQPGGMPSVLGIPSFLPSPPWLGTLPPGLFLLFFRQAFGIKYILASADVYTSIYVICFPSIVGQLHRTQLFGLNGRILDYHCLKNLFFSLCFGAQPSQAGRLDTLPYQPGTAVWAELYLPQPSAVGLQSQVEGLQNGHFHLTIVRQLF